MIKVYGDSWVYGSELNEGEKPFTYHLEQLTGIKTFNYGLEGCAYGHMTHTILTDKKPNSNTFIIVVIPPDIRWYSETHGNYYSLFNLGDIENLSAVHPAQLRDFEHYYDTLNVRESWFNYNSTLFTYTLYNYFKERNTGFLLMHNYGTLSHYSNLKSMIPEDIFLSYDMSLTAILGGEDRDLYAEKKDGPVPEMFTGKYFEGNETHPNELGHKRIAELIYNNSRFQNWLK